MLRKISKLARSRVGKFLSTVAMAGVLYGCGDSGNVANACQEGEKKACVTGLEGICSAGTQTCADGGWGACAQNSVASAEECDGLDNDCDGTVDNGDLCDNGLYCDGQEECVGGVCVEGDPVDCSEYDLAAVAQCDFDTNLKTLDSRDAFTSECVEVVGGYECSKSDLEVNSVCDVNTCGADCATDDDCVDTVCDDRDGCVGKDYHDYENVLNTCEDDCGCTEEVCGDPVVYENDARCVTCSVDDDCDNLDADVCELDIVKHNEGRCVSGECMVESTVISDCNALDIDTCEGDSVRREDYTCAGGACVLGQSSIVQDCNDLDRDYCDGSTLKNEDYACNGGLCVIDSTNVLEECDDGLYCNGVETCLVDACVGGTAADCSGNDIAAVMSCTDPSDGSALTWDSRDGFTSSCVEKTNGYDCTTGDATISHTCDTTACGAGCEDDGDCASTDCESLDGCVGNDFYDYANVANSCVDCSCETNVCGAPVVTVNDARCVDCVGDDDCNALDEDYCEDDLIRHKEGKCVGGSCEVEITTVEDCSTRDNNYCSGSEIKRDSYTCLSASCSLDVSEIVEDCDDGLYCNGVETCSGAACVDAADADCSGNDIAAVASCNNVPDGNAFTWDSRSEFTSSCVEGATNYSCTSGSSAIDSECSVAQCSAECDDSNSCSDNTCSVTFNDYCDNGKLVEFDTDKIMDSTTVNDSCSNTCLSGCSCTDCATDCSAPATSTYCVTGACGATCEDNVDCAATDCDTLDGCVGKDYHDYADVDNDCVDCSCETNVCGAPTVLANDARCTECQDDGDCDALDNDYCVGSEITHDEGKCVDFECETETTTVTDCDDGLYCNGVESCVGAGSCDDPADADCSGNNLAAIAACDYTPDGNSSTWDSRAEFTSVCEEDTGGYTCTTGDTTVAHACDVTSCGAACEDNSDCADTECDDLDGCYSGTYRDYHDVANTCAADCSCTANPCDDYTEVVTDVDLDTYDIECDNDCNDNDDEMNPGQSEDRNTSGLCEITDLDGKDNNCDGTVDEICMSAVITAPPVTFPMGCDNGTYSCDGDDTVHDVTLTKGYSIDTFEVTNEQYLACETAGACTAPSNNSSFTNPSYHDNAAFANFPVLYVNWDQAVDFCGWAGKSLPTEAQWEYAARSGDEREFPWGGAAADCTRLNYNMCTGDVEVVDSHGTGVSPFGAYNMSGNVQEWVADWYDPYTGDPETDPTGPPVGGQKVVRGGNFVFPQYIQTFNRGPSQTPDTSNFVISIRCIKGE